MKIKLSSRERLMLVVLLIVATIALSYRFIYLPVTLDNQMATSVHASVMAEEKVLVDNVLSEAAMQEKISNLKRLSHLLTKQLPPSIEQEYAVKDLLMIAKNNGVELLSFSFEGEDDPISSEGVESVDDALALYEKSFNQKTESINELKNMFSADEKTQNVEASSAEDEEELPIQYMSMTINCRGVYSNLRGVLRDFNELDNMVVVKEISFAKERDSITGVLADITLEFPYYPDNSIYELAPWDGLDVKSSDVDPFNYIIRGSQLDPNIPKISTTISTNQYNNPLEPAKVVSKVDFYIGARPKSSDDFAYTIGKKGDSTYRLSSDLDGEALELVIVDNNGKPAFKMGTKLRPITDETKAVVFAPEASSKINIEVISQPRIGTKDKLSGSLKIKNTSSIPVVIKVVDEDASNPRLNILKEGDVTIK